MRISDWSSDVCSSDLAVDAGSSALSYSWGPFDLMSLAFGAWVAGMIAVLVAALVADRRFRQAVLEEAVELEPIGSIRLEMTDAIDEIGRHTSELQSLMRISYAVFCLKKKTNH